MDLSVGVWDLYFVVNILMTRIQVSSQGPMGPLALSIDSHMKKTSGSLVDLKGAYVQE